MVNVEKMQILLRDRDMTYAELGEKTGMAAAVVHRYCTGKVKAIPADRLASIAKALGTTPEYLLDEEPRNEEERSVLAAYNSLSPDNQKLIDDLMQRLLRVQDR